MASWKEKGEVPDSDDENGDDSQSLSNEGYSQGRLQEPRDAQRLHIGGIFCNVDTKTGDAKLTPLQTLQESHCRGLSKPP
jgi:hypothetical protein